MIQLYVYLCILVVASVLLYIHPLHFIPAGPQLYHDRLHHRHHSQESHVL